MSFKERLQDVSSETELHNVMRELWAFGSPNWTLELVSRYAPPEFFYLFDRYFDEQGRLHDRFPDDLPSGSWMPSPTPATRSLSELITTFPDRLLAIRSTPPLPSSGPRQEPLFPEESADGAQTSTTAMAAAPATLPEADFLEDTDSAERGFLCPICQKRADMEPVYYRNLEMCPTCAAKLRKWQ